MDTTKPYIIGICGNSGCGKSSFVKTLVKILGKKDTLIMCFDDYHKWPRGSKEWSKYTHLNPEANNISWAETHLDDLKKGNSIYKLEYCHKTGKLIGPFKVTAKKFIILEGLHSLYSKKLREQIDFKIFIDCHQDLNTHFKLHRDLKKRGHKKETILKSIESRKQDTKKYINPQKKYADLVIEKNPLIPLREDKEKTPVEFSFIHNKKNPETMFKFLKNLFGNKIECKANKKNPTLKTTCILKTDELTKLKKIAKTKFDLKLENNIFGLCQLITAYNLSLHGHKIGRLPHTHK